MKKTIALVGCGNLGSRHLQAIAKLPHELQVEIIEPSNDAQKLAKSRLEEIQYNKKLHKYSWYREIQELTNVPDLTIVSTKAIGRAKLLCQLADVGHTRFLIEKMVCQSNDEYEIIVSKFQEKNAKAWVNTSRRYFISYQKLRQYFGDSKIFHMSVTSSNVSALGTSAIHYMDLFAYFTGEYKIKMNGDLLLNEIFPNKRGSNLMEFAGTVTGMTNNGSRLTLSFLPSDRLSTIVNIIAPNKHIMIDETNQRIFDLVDFKNKELSFENELVSSITTKIASDILQKDCCDLTTLEDSQVLHNEIFKMFNAHVEKVTGKHVELCPIT